MYRHPDRRNHPIDDPPDRDLDPPEPDEPPHGLVPYGGGLYGLCECDKCLRQEKLRAEWEEMQEEKDDPSS